MNVLAKCLVLASLALCCVHVQCQDCSLEGYDVGTLAERNYWTARVGDPKHCLLPLNYTLEDVVSCDIFFSVCKSLQIFNGTRCESSSSCQKIVTTDGNITYFDMGAYKPDEEFDPLGGGETGFAVARSAAESIISEDCNGTVFSVTTFVCESDSMWDPNDSNVSTHLEFVKEGFFGISCTYVIQFNYTGGCYIAPTLSPSHCTLDEYDTSTLKNKEYWLAKVDDSVCYDSSVSTCMMYISFCHPVPPSIGAGCYGSSVCQIGTFSSGKQQELSMGAYANFTRFHENDEKGVNGGFYMRVENGSKPENGSKCPNGISTQVTLTCDSSKSWNHQDISDYVSVAYHHDEGPCSYMLKIGYKGACIKEGPIATGSLPQSPFGWILIGIFSLAVITYVAVGMIYNRLRKGATGLQLIPHYDFWFSFMMHVLEGCYFFLDLITCFKFDGRVKNIVRKQPDYDKI